jgi:hypothetical protein
MKCGLRIARVFPPHKKEDDRLHARPSAKYRHCPATYKMVEKMMERIAL